MEEIPPQSEVTLRINFLDPSKFRSLSNVSQSLCTPELSKTISLSVIYNPSRDQQSPLVQKAIRTAVPSAFTGTFLTSMALGGSLSLFWNLLNTIQLLALLPLFGF